MTLYVARHSLIENEGPDVSQARAICSFVNHQAFLGSFHDSAERMQSVLNSMATDEKQKALKVTIVRIVDGPPALQERTRKQ